MSSTILNVVFTRALQLWADPKHRCKGHEKRQTVYGMQYCAIGVLKQARKDCGVNGNNLPIKKLAKALGFWDDASLIQYNDSGRLYLDCSESNRYDESIINRYNQDNIYQRMQDFVKGTIDNDFHERNKAEGVQ